MIFWEGRSLANSEEEKRGNRGFVLFTQQTSHPCFYTQRTGEEGLWQSATPPKWCPSRIPPSSIHHSLHPDPLPSLKIIGAPSPAGAPGRKPL